MKKYGIKITYSWGDKEPTIVCLTKEDAWTQAREMAAKEAEIASEEHDCEIGISFNKAEGKITLHYTYDDEYCYYEVVEI